MSINSKVVKNDVEGVKLLLSNQQFTQDEIDNEIGRVVQRGYISILELFLKYEADSTIRVRGMTLMHLAVNYNHFECAQLLMGTNTDLNIVVHGRTALQLAIHQNKPTYIRLLTITGPLLV